MRHTSAFPHSAALLILLFNLYAPAASAQSCPLQALKGKTEEYLDAARKVVRERSYLEKDANCFFEAVASLGHMRSVESAPDLIEVLDVRKTEPWENSPYQTSKVTKLGHYPAALALVSIGRPAVPALMKVVSENEFDSVVSDVARYTIVSIVLKEQKPDPVALFREAAERSTSVERKARFEKAAEEARHTMDRLEEVRQKDRARSQQK